MKHTGLCLMLVVVTLVPAVASGPAGLTVEGSAATFRSATNITGIEVSGASKAVTAQAELEVVGTGLSIRKVDATVPVRSLSTGMKMRDEHMRKYIFTSASGEQPNLRFEAEGMTCPAGAQGHEFVCRLSGSLSFRGVSKPFVLNLKAREQGAVVFRVTGEGTLKLDDFGVTPPEQFGVKLKNEVEIRLDFVGKQVAAFVAPFVAPVMTAEVRK